jgi:YHS domain-containing protein
MSRWVAAPTRKAAAMKLRTTLFLLPALVLLPLLSAARPTSAEETKKAKCIVSGKEIDITPKTPKVYIQGKPAYFCCENCPKAFQKTPEKFVKIEGKCPIFGTDLTNPTPELRLVINNGLWYVCCPGCIDGVNKEPQKLKVDLIDVVSGKAFKVTDLSPKSEFKGQSYYFENVINKQAFDQDSPKYAVIYAK